jgi:hypothetical protein
VQHLHTVPGVSSNLTVTTNLSRIRLAAMPPRLGRGFRRFESYMRDQLAL